MTKQKTGGLLLVLLAVILVGIFALLFLFDSTSYTHQSVIGYITTGSSSEQGWNGIHIKAIRQASDRLGAKLLLKENIPESAGLCADAARELIDAGAKMLILNSFNYILELNDLSEANPEIFFYVNTSQNINRANVKTYFARLYQVRYLTGIVAGMITRTNSIGYVAAMDNTEVDRGINAFTLGVRSVNPDARVIVTWTGNWDNADCECASVQALVERENIDVVTYHQNQPYSIDAAEKAGIYSIGYHQAFTGYSDNCLTSAMCNWELVYEAIIREYMQGRAKNTSHYWIGLEKNAVQLAPFSSKVSAEIRATVGTAAGDIRSGRDVFSGEIYDAQGVLRCCADETMTDRALLEDMDWFVQGVCFLGE